MAEAPAWRARLLQRVLVAREHVRDVHERLATLETVFFLPLSAVSTGPGPEDEMDALFLKLDLAMGSLMSATQSLNSALVSMEAAQILALHGGNVDPLVPLDAAVQAAMHRLQTSQVMAQSASRILEWARGHLSMSHALVLLPGIPNSMELGRLEYDTAYVALVFAIQTTQTALAALGS